MSYTNDLSTESGRESVNISALPLAIQETRDSIILTISSTPTDGATENAISSDWAYDHINDTTTHGTVGDIVGTIDTQVLTNKSISGSANTITNIDETALALTDITTGDTNVTAHGFCPKLSGNAGQFLDGTGSFSAPSGSGDVLGPVANTDAYVPQWDGLNTKTLKDGLAFLDEDNMVSDSAVSLASQQSIKAYVDTQDAAERTYVDSNFTNDADTDISTKGWIIDEDDMISDDDTKVPTQQSVKAYADTAITAGVFPSGTIMLFGQTAAPTGWTKKVDWTNNSVIQYTTGAISQGGTVNMNAHTHDDASHTHGNGSLYIDDNVTHSHNLRMLPMGGGLSSFVNAAKVTHSYTGTSKSGCVDSSGGGSTINVKGTTAGTAITTNTPVSNITWCSVIAATKD